MSFRVIIPARFQSTRLPGKMLAAIGDMSMIEQVVCRANESVAQEVIVATDDDRISQQLVNAQCQVIMTAADHVSGSDRLAEAVEKLGLNDDQIIVNVQGDEPLIPADLINQVAALLLEQPDINMATAATAISDEGDFVDPNVVKVVINGRSEAMYFSRAAIPFKRNAAEGSVPNAWHHIGIYAYRVGFLKNYHALPHSELEQRESLEQLRVLENGDKILVHTTELEVGFGIDTQADLDRARALLADNA